MISFVYGAGNHPGTVRTVEPYSFRTKKNFLLFAWDREAESIKAYRMDLVSDVKETDTSFTPRYAVEL